MTLYDTKSLNELSEKELIQFVIANQVTILRRLDYLESKIADNEERSHEDTIIDLVFKVESNKERINEKLLKDFTER